MESIYTLDDLHEYLQTNTLDQIDGYGYTPLIHACEHEIKDVILEMLSYGTDACALSHVGGHRSITALIIAIECINPEYDTYNDVECRKKKDIIIKMLNFGSEACALRNIDYADCTALHHACFLMSSEVALEILCFGSEACNMYHEDCDGKTALVHAKKHGLADVVERIEELMEEDDKQFPVCKGQMN